MSNIQDHTLEKLVNAVQYLLVGKLLSGRQNGKRTQGNFGFSNRKCLHETGEAAGNRLNIAPTSSFHEIEHVPGVQLHGCWSSAPDLVVLNESGIRFQKR
jgi:hypothetical protein